MCCCGKPTRNDEPGYRWQPGDAPMVRGVNPPEIAEGDALLFDEPGRCCPSVAGEPGRTDYHSHHYRIIKDRFGGVALLVRHGGGDERLDLGGDYRKAGEIFGALPGSDARYLLCALLFDMEREGADKATQKERRYWIDAAKEGRIRTRKRRGSNIIDVRVKVREEEAYSA